MSSHFDDNVEHFLDAASEFITDPKLKEAAAALRLSIRERRTDRATYAEQIEKARGQTSDDLEIDDNPEVSAGDDGVWVQAWVWVPARRWLNHYRCPECGEGWEDVWSAQSDDTCWRCGARDISPHTSEEV